MRLALAFGLCPTVVWAGFGSLGTDTSCTVGPLDLQPKQQTFVSPGTFVFPGMSVTGSSVPG